jgi:predicted TIM-barrel fold metal-dependent hydrolase
MEPRVDVFCHILPKKFDAERWKRVGKTNFVKHSPSHLKYVQGGKSAEQENVKVLMDLDARWRMMDEFPGYRQVISVASPPVEAVDPDDSEYLAKILNDEMAELVAKYPDRFAGAAASLPMNKPEAAAKELERCITELKMPTLQIFSNVNGKPLDLAEYRPVFEIMSKHDLPILLHPARSIDHWDYPTEPDSKFIIWQVFGWPYETTAAMTRIAFGGVLDDFPNLKIICHHSGAMVPFFAGRIKSMYRMLEPLIVAERKGRPFSKPILEYFRAFYADCSTFTTASIETAIDFFGVEQVIFGSDAPFDFEGGRASIRECTDAINASRLSAADKTKIFSGNFEKHFRLPAAVPAAAAKK